MNRERSASGVYDWSCYNVTTRRKASAVETGIGALGHLADAARVRGKRGRGRYPPGTLVAAPPLCRRSSDRWVRERKRALKGGQATMRMLIAGMDGYLGWSLAQHLTLRGHEVAGADALLRRSWVAEMGSVSAIPIASIEERLRALRADSGQVVPFWNGDLRDYALVERIFQEFEPEAVIHLGECPSAPYSMIDRDHATFVQ